MKKLPIGISTFEEIRSENYLYIDKTEYAHKLVRESKYYFLSRPRRFGKSLFVSMLKSLFQGKKELFKGLYIYDKYDFEAYPVISINFTDNMGDTAKVQQSIKYNFQKCEEELGIVAENKDYLPSYFADLIRKAYEKTGKKVVVLVDEYDKPITDNVENPEIMRKNRDVLRNIYSIIKGSDEFIKFCFLTGVSKFVKVSIFSGLNNLDDITLDGQFDAICGYTHSELENSFSEYLQDVDIKQLSHWYNGYNFFGEKVYNPYNILLFFQKGKMYRNYWFESGTTSFLVSLIKQKQYFLPNLDNLLVDEMLLNSFEIENINIETLLFQSGYLTIKKIEESFDGYEYTLDFPNFEVRNAFNKLFFRELSDLRNVNYHKNTRKAFLLCDMELLKENLYRLFASIPYQNSKIQTYEGYYASIMFTHLKTIGLEVVCEDRTNKGRIDMLVKTPEYLYILEFKLGKENALQQIKDKAYHEKYSDQKIMMIGINFDKEERNITKFEWEEIS